MRYLLLTAADTQEGPVVLVLRPLLEQAQDRIKTAALGDPISWILGHAETVALILRLAESLNSREATRLAMKPPKSRDLDTGEDEVRVELWTRENSNSIIGLYDWFPDLRDFALIAREAQADIISANFSLVTEEKAVSAHAAGLELVPWTANTPADWDKLIKPGVDAIITDDPAELIAYLKKKRLR